MPISAYLNVFDDWDLLEASVASIEPYVDEIVVVDGAYRWMAPALDALGRDPTRSDPRVAAALAPFSGKTRFVNGLWDDENQKRAAGYAACSHRWIMRADADEIVYFDPAALERTLMCGAAVGQIEIPLYLTPGWVRRRKNPDGSDGTVERLPALFDRRQVSAKEHLVHLWLFTSQAEKDEIRGERRADAHAESYAFAAHLTQWRGTESASNRARFYVANWLRQHRPDELKEMSEPGNAANWMSGLEGHVIVAGLPDMDGFAVRPTPLSPDQERLFSGLFDAKMLSFASDNAKLARTGRTVGRGDFTHVDLSTDDTWSALGAVDRRITFASSLRIVDVRAEAITLRASDDQPLLERNAWTAIEPHGTGSLLHVEMPFEPEEGRLLRRVLRLRCWDGADTKWIDLRVTRP